MKQSTKYYRKHEDVVIIEETASIFENIASIRIRQVKEQVLASRGFFGRLWSIYTGLRVEENEIARLKRATTDRPMTVLISSNVNLVGPIDSHLLDVALRDFDAKTTDLMVIGLHGEHMVKQRGFEPKYSFPLPDITKPIDIQNIVTALAQYAAPVVYYPSYTSLTEQKIVNFTLIEAVKTLSELEQQQHPEGLIYADEYIFEPSEEEFIQYLESMMVQVILTEVILEASLAQFASRFTAMTSAEQRAIDINKKLLANAKRSRRLEHDELDRKYVGKRQRSYSI